MQFLTSTLNISNKKLLDPALWEFWWWLPSVSLTKLLSKSKLNKKQSIFEAKLRILGVSRSNSDVVDDEANILKKRKGKKRVTIRTWSGVTLFFYPLFMVDIIDVVVINIHLLVRHRAYHEHSLYHNFLPVSLQMAYDSPNGMMDTLGWAIKTQKKPVANHVAVIFYPEYCK